MHPDYKHFVAKKAAPTQPLNENQFAILHGALGLATEVLELTMARSRSHTIEEGGDLLFYFEYTSQVLEMDLPTEAVKFQTNSNMIAIDELQVSIEEFISCVKKHVIYGVDQGNELYCTFNTAWRCYRQYIHACNLTIPVLVQANVDKLNQRYVDSFTPEESEQRRDKDGE